jgi:hypothetical protein
LDEGEPGEFSTAWSVVCEEHGAIVGLGTRRDAELAAADPRGFCEDCQAEAQPTRTHDSRVILN